jgi:hypothetical protein
VVHYSTGADGSFSTGTPNRPGTARSEAICGLRASTAAPHPEQKAGGYNEIGLAMVDVDPIRARLTAITPGSWRRHGSDIYAGGDQTTPLLRGRVRNAEVRAQTDADAEFVAHAAAR